MELYFQGGLEEPFRWAIGSKKHTGSYRMVLSQRAAGEQGRVGTSQRTVELCVSQVPGNTAPLVIGSVSLWLFTLENIVGGDGEERAV